MPLYRCHKIYKCKCARKSKHGNKLPLVSRSTAFRHRREAVNQNRIPSSLPFPAPNSDSSSDSASSDSDSSRSASASKSLADDSESDHVQPSQSSHDDESGSLNQSKDKRVKSGDVYREPEESETEDESSAASGSESGDESNEPTQSEAGGSDFDSLSVEFLDDLEGFDAFSPAEIRLKSTMEKCLWILQFRLKFHLVDEAVDYLIKREKRNYPDEVQLSTFKSLKKSICNYANLRIKKTPYCSLGHKALELLEDGTVGKCNHKLCRNIEQEIGYYKSISLWDQIKILIQSPHYGPLIFNYHQERLRELDLDVERDNEWFSDYYDGDDFKNYVRDQGGADKFRDNIFLDISTDGVQPYRSSLYSYWPVILFICNIPPEERFKLRNIMPLMFIPGSRRLKKGPEDLHSFLSPLYDELHELSKGKYITRWDGEQIFCRCEPWRVKLDLDACKKLTNLSGYNGLAPCRFSLFHGARCPIHNHYYFPDKSYQRNEQGELYLHTHYDINNLDIRTFDTIADQYSSVRGLGTKKDKKNAMKRLGLASLSETPFFNFSSIRSFFSFPVDPMHLLYENVAPFLLDIWINYKKYEDLAVLSKTSTFNIVNENLMSCQNGISSDLLRSQRGLNNKGNWKAHEFMTFATLTSLSVLDQWVPDTLLNGWQLFSRICLYSSAHRLSRRMLDNFDADCKAFFRHFMSKYYKYEPERLHLCRYVIHLILHLPTNVERSGPVSLLGQWSMENYAGCMNRRCNATDRFAESVFEGSHLELSTRSYCIRNAISLDKMYEDHDICSPTSPSLLSKGEGEYAGYVMKHPKKEVHVSTLDTQLIERLTRFYSTRKDISSNAATKLLLDNPLITIWERLECSGDVSLSGRPCILSTNECRAERKSCYFLGAFEEGEHKYGCANFFIRVITLHVFLQGEPI